jgi:hypothetical protein
LVSPPPPDQELDLAGRLEDLSFEQLVAEPDVEALAVTVLSGTRRDRN